MAWAQLYVSAPDHKNSLGVGQHVIFFFWLAYGLAVTAGLMAIGHANAIAEQAGLNRQLILIAPSVLALFSMCVSLLGGWMADRVSFKVTLTVLPLLSALCLVLLALF